MRRRLWALGLYIVVLILCYPGVFAGTKSFFVGDNYSLLVPGKIFLVNQLRQGVLPFWNPYIFSGIPFFADMSQAIFFPTTWLFIFLKIALAINLSIILDCLGLALGIYELSSLIVKKQTWTLISGAVFLLTQPIILVTTGNLAVLNSLTLVPWMIVCAIKSRDDFRYLALLPGLIAVSILGGHPQPTLMGIVISCIFIILVHQDKLVTRFLKIGFLGVISGLLVSFALVPFTQLSSLSTRMSQNVREILDFNSTQPLQLMDTIVPNLFINPRYGLIWGINWNSPPKAGLFTTYFGLVTIVLMLWLWSKNSYSQKIMLMVGLVFLGISLGKYLPGFEWAFTHIPVMSWFRNIPLFNIGYMLAISVLVPHGIELIYQNMSKHKWPKRIDILMILGVILGALVLSYSWWFKVVAAPILNHPRVFHNYARDYEIGFNILCSVSVSLICFGLGLRIIKDNRSIWLLCGVMVVNLWFVNTPFAFLAPNSVYDLTNDVVRHLPKDNNYRTISINDFMPYVGMSNYWSNLLIAPPFGETQYDQQEKLHYNRLIQKKNTLAPNWNMVYNVASINGYATFVPTIVANYWRNNSSSSNVNTIDYSSFHDERLNEQGVKYIVVDKSVFSDKKIPQELSDYPVVTEKDNWAIVQNPEAKPIITFADNLGNIYPDTGNVNEINFRTNRQTDGKIMVNMTFFPGWKGVMDGIEWSLMSTRGGISMWVPNGSHSIKLTYSPPGWPILPIVGGGFWLVYLMIITLKWRLWKN